MKTSYSALALTAVFLVGCVESYPVRDYYRRGRHHRELPPTEYEDREPERERERDREPKPDAEPFIVRSPFGNHRKMDLTGMDPGTKVQDPITGGIFRVPASKDEAPEIVSEPPADWKPEN